MIMRMVDIVGAKEEEIPSGHGPYLSGNDSE